MPDFERELRERAQSGGRSGERERQLMEEGKQRLAEQARCEVRRLLGEYDIEQKLRQMGGYLGGGWDLRVGRVDVEVSHQLWDGQNLVWFIANRLFVGKMYWKGER